MECLQSNSVLKFHPNTLEAVREEINLNSPKRIKEAVDILENWVQMQPHFVKKDFSREYLERALISSKGLVERAKEKLDKLCTFKTLMPEFFANATGVKKEMEPLLDIIIAAHLPEMTPQHHRVYFCRAISENLESTAIFSFYKYLAVISEYMLQFEYCSGFQIVMDFTNVNILAYATKLNPMEFRQCITLMTDGYGCRIKGVHVISTSKMVDALIALLKQVFSAKVSERIHLHKSIDTLTEYIPKEIMPSEYGGKEKSLLELNKEWHNIIGSKEFVEYLTEMNKASTNESCRRSDKFNEHYVGMPGSFRALSVD